jgi:AraC-like DNA-binding protein
VGSASFSAPPESQLKFIDVALSKDSIMNKKQGIHNFIFFVISGEVEIHDDLSKNVHRIQEGYFYILSCDQECKIIVLNTTHILIMQFASIIEESNINYFQKLSVHKRSTPYVFTVLPINVRLTELINLIVDGLKAGMECFQFHLYCEGILLIMLRKLYDDEQLLGVFYKVIGERLDFRSKVLQNYTHIHTVKQFAELLSMSKSTFIKTFQDEFGSNVKVWLTEKKKDFIMKTLSDPTITVKDLMFRCGFDTPSNFTRFFKQNFNCTPTYAIENKRDFILENNRSTDLELSNTTSNPNSAAE